jgi:signal transduction histidine kinase
LYLFPKGTAKMSTATRLLASFLCLAAICGVDATRHASAQAAGVVLTAPEQAWLQAHPVITMAADENNPPIMFRRADGDRASFSGACYDYAALAARNAGLTVQYEGSTWDEALKKGMAHEVDGVLCARDRPERRSRLNFSSPYMELPIGMATRPDHAEMRALGGFAGERIAVVRGTVRVPVIRARCPDCRVIEVASPKQGMELVRQRQADGYFDDMPVIQRAMTAAPGQYKIALLYYDSEAATIRLALRNDQPELLSIINKGLAAITGAEHEQIRARWLGGADGAPVERALQLTPAQRAWLAAHPLIRVGVDSSRAPVEWRGEDGKLRGISLDFLARISDMLGVRFELVPMANVAEELAGIEQRRVDLASGLSQNASRQRYMLLSDSYLNTPLVIFGKTGSSPTGGLAGLKGRRVAVSARTAVADAIARDWPTITAVPSANFRSATQLLRSGQVQGIVGPLLTGTHQLVELGAADVQVVGETDYNYQIGIGVRSDWPELVPMLNLALAAIPKSERDSFRQKWSTVRFEHEMDYRPLWALALAVLVAVAFILQLRVMVKRRTRELQDEVAMRRAREEEIQQLNAALEARVDQRTAQLRQANDDLRLAADHLVQTEKVASLGRLVAGIAHELNTPLGSTLTAATTLKAHLGSFRNGLLSGTLKRSTAEDFVGQCHQACDIIERNAYRAAGLIDNFKELAVDQASARRRRFPLKRTVEEVLATHHNAWKATPHKIELDIDEAIELDSFPGPLAQVLSNMLENSLVHGLSQNSAGCVRIVARLHGDEVALTYSDDGNGIPPQFHNKIYDPFFTTRLGQGGSGLGLYIVQTLVTGVLGGQIGVQSQPGQGTQFHITLPLVAPVLQEGTASGAHGLVAVPPAPKAA